MSRLFGKAAMNASYSFTPSSKIFLCCAFCGSVSVGAFEALSVSDFATRSDAISRASGAIFGLLISSRKWRIASS